MERLINALLNDEHGISEEAYNALADYLCFMANTQDRFCMADLRLAQRLLPEVKRANATDGRFYYD